jgi:hypothetical protein
MHLDRRQHPVCFCVALLQLRGDLEPIDQQTRPARAVRVLQEMKRLQARRVAEVGRVRVRLERNVGVRRVLRRQVGGEVVEAAVVRFADEGDAREQRFRGGWVWVGQPGDVGEAEATLWQLDEG